MHSKNQPPWRKHPELELTTYVFHGRRRAPTWSARGIHRRRAGTQFINDGSRRGTNRQWGQQYIWPILGTERAVGLATRLTPQCTSAV